jgi:hypothetical protein
MRPGCAGASAGSGSTRRSGPVVNTIEPGSLRLLKLALGALEDVMDVRPDEAIEVCRWMARTLTAAVIRAHIQGTGA